MATAVLWADLPVSKGIAQRARVLSDDEIQEIWRATSGAETPPARNGGRQSAPLQGGGD